MSVFARFLRYGAGAALAGGAVLATVPSVASMDGIESALSPKEWRALKLRESKPLTHNTRFLRFDLPSNQTAGLTVASCITVRATVDGGEQVVRPYTPVNRVDARGQLDLVIKAYPAPHGTMSRHIFGLKPGDKLEVKGPFKKIDGARQPRRSSRPGSRPADCSPRRAQLARTSGSALA